MEIDTSPLAQGTLLKEIQDLSRQIAEQQAMFNNGTLKGLAATFGLQTLRQKRREVLTKLVKPTLAWEHPFPESLPPVEKRTRNEVRALMGLPPVEEE